VLSENIPGKAVFQVYGKMIKLLLKLIMKNKVAKFAYLRNWKVITPLSFLEIHLNQESLFSIKTFALKWECCGSLD